MEESSVEHAVMRPQTSRSFDWRTFDPSMLPGGMNATLARELVTFRDRLDEMLDGHEGDFVVIKGDEIVGYHADREDALRTALEKFGGEPALIKRVMDREPLVSIGRVL
jgi:hypothetical protein